MTIRVLHVVSALGGGGVEQMLLNYYQHIDRDKISYDFIVHGARVGEHEEIFEKMGSNIFHATPKRVSFWKNLRFISRIIREGDYDVVHAHQNLSNAIPLILAKYYKVPVRISHGHGFPSMNTIAAVIVKRGIEFSATDFFACTAEVGAWLHPRKWGTTRSRSFIMRNAFDLTHFTFDPQARKEWREYLGLDSELVMIQVGRLSPEKNHSFTFELLRRLQDSVPCNLLVVGDGLLKESLTYRAQELGVTDKVKFLGFQNDIPGILAAADIAVMPSFTEGLGLAAVEAQAAGLPVIASEALPEEVRVSEMIVFLPLDLELWVEQIESKSLQRNAVEEDSVLQNYDIEPAAKKYTEYLVRVTTQENLGV